MNRYLTGSAVRQSKLIISGLILSFSDGNDKENEKRLSKFVRIGKNKELLNDDIFKRRLNKFMRIGRQPGLNDVDSFGDNEAFEADAKRRISSFVRIGKSGNAAQESKLETDEKA